MKKLIIFISILIFSNTAFSSNKNLPYGFENLFEFEESKLKIRNLDGTFTTPISFLTKFDTVKLDRNDEKAIKQINDFLKSNSIANSNKDKIVESLIVGIKDSGLCKGKFNECEIETDTYYWLFNYNEKEIYLFINPTLLDYNSALEDGSYHSTKSESNGLINSFDFYINQYSDHSSSVTLNDVVTMGLPYGYIKTDFSLNNFGDDSLYEAAYNLDLEGHTLKLGHFEYGSDVNSTGFLDGIVRVPQQSITLASSERLFIGGQSSDQLISFYAPVSGSVKVYRDGRVIYQKNTKEGQNKIFYNELPKGRYEVQLEIISSGNVLGTYIYQIYNSAQDTLAEGKFDYLLSAGFFDDSYFSDNYYNSTFNSESVEDDAFGKVLIGYRAIPSLLVGAGSTFSNDNQLITVGLKYYWMHTDIELESVYTNFSDASHFNIDLGLKRLNISYENLDDGYNDSLARYIYGPFDYSRLSISSSYSFGNARSIYFLYSNSRQTNELEYRFSDYKNRYESISLGYSSPFYLGSRLDLNIDYTHVDDSDDEVSVNLSWNIPLSKTVDLISGITSSDSDITQVSTSLRKDHLIKSRSFDSSIELRNIYHPGVGSLDAGMNQQALLNIAGSSDYGRIDASAYISTEAQHGLTMGLSSTQVFTEEGINFSDKKSSSYLLIDVNRAGDLDEHMEKGSFSLRKDNKQDTKFIVYKDSILVPVQDYYQYKAYFDSESVELFNSGDSYSNFFSHPGSVVKLKTKVSRVVSFVSAFNDLDDQPVKDILCEGVGCLRLNEIVDGVYRITVLEGANFELYSNLWNIKHRCLLPYELSNTELMNFGTNYCLPMKENHENIFVNTVGQSFKVRFVGIYEDHPDVMKTLKKLESLGYLIIQKNIGRLKATYVSLSEDNFDDMYVKHKFLFEELKNLAKKKYSIDVINYPVVKVE